MQFWKNVSKLCGSVFNTSRKMAFIWFYLILKVIILEEVKKNYENI
jgi:hypothetical protein